MVAFMIPATAQMHVAEKRLVDGNRIFVAIRVNLHPVRVFVGAMTETDRLDDQARRCRRLAGGLSNRDDVRALEELASEFERRAERLRLSLPLRPSRQAGRFSALRIIRS
jgi:hypothetical protein